MNVKQKAYYAHAMCLYGHLVERQEVATIRRRIKGAHIVNPAKYEGHPEKQRDKMAFCLRLVEECDVVVFSKLLGKITAGVGKEINYALRLKRPVYEICGGKLVRQVRPVNYLSVAHTISQYWRWEKKYLG
jgi:hypothetical protein